MSCARELTANSTPPEWTTRVIRPCKRRCSVELWCALGYHEPFTTDGVHALPAERTILRQAPPRLSPSELAGAPVRD